MKYLTSLIQKNPLLLSKYVSLGYNLIDKAVVPLNKLMVHLLEVQGISPKTQPGDAIQKALNGLVDDVVPESSMQDAYDADFNFARFQKNASVRLQGLGRDQFVKLTDLTHTIDLYPPEKEVNEEPLRRTVSKKENVKSEVEVKRAPVSVGRVKRAKKTATVTKTFNSGPFRRVKV